MESALKEEYFEAVVPDTLDLAERAALAINALTRAADAKFKYETPRGAHLDHQPAFMSWRNSGLVMQRPIRALPKMRVMSGSTQNSDVDARKVEAVVRTIEKDNGLWWLDVKDSPWRAGFQVDQCWPAEQGELMVALLDWYEYDHDPKWLNLVGNMAGGLAGIGLRNEDRAWYFTAYTRSGSWRNGVLHEKPWA